MGRVDVGGHELRVEVEGEGAPTFLCLHGLVDRVEIWDRLAPALAKRGRVIRVDQRGHGESDAPAGPTTRADLARDAITVLDAHDASKAIFVGHSMGGIVSMAAALAHAGRVAALVLLGTASHCNEKTARWYERIAVAGERAGLEGLARAIYGEKSRKRIVGDARGIAAVTRTLKELHTDPLTPQLARIACPTLLVVGEKDPMGERASQAIAEAIGPERATLVTIPGAGHWIHVESVEPVLEALDDFLERHEPKEGWA